MKTMNATEKSVALDARFELFLTLFVRTETPRRRPSSRRR
jgi:hypothetical protein